MVLGDVYYDIGEYGDAETMYRAALDLRRELLGERHVDVASTLSEYGEAIRKQWRYDEAERLLVEALALHRELLGDDHPAVGLTLYRLGMVHVRRRDGVRAEALLREAQGIYRRHPSRDTRTGQKRSRGAGPTGIVAATPRLSTRRRSPSSGSIWHA